MQIPKTICDQVQTEMSIMILDEPVKIDESLLYKIKLSEADGKKTFYFHNCPKILPPNFYPILTNYLMTILEFHYLLSKLDLKTRKKFRKNG